MWISLNAHNTEYGVRWRLASVRPAHLVRHGGLYVWERSGEIHLDVPPVTTRAMMQAILDELQRALGEREHLGVGGE